MKRITAVFAATLCLSLGVESKGSEKIFFSSNRASAPGPDQFHLWMMDPDGTGFEQLTFGAVQDLHPELSPDGTQLLFYRATSERPTGQASWDCHSIWVLDLPTMAETKITNDFPETPYTSTNPTWSPDGSQIAFDRSLASSNCIGGVPRTARIWIVNYFPAIGVPVQISPAGGLSRLWPSWSHDGSNIAYGQEVGGAGPWEIFKFVLATGTEERLIPRVGQDQVPRYSPDGTLITWNRSTPAGHIYVADLSDPASLQLRVSPTSSALTQFDRPAWSPDSSRLVFNCREGIRGGDLDICVVNVDGTDFTRLVSGPAVDFWPWWDRLNELPVADAGPDQLVPAGEDCQASVNLDGSGSFDPDGDRLDYSWSGPFGTASGASPTVSLPLGDHAITLRVDDGHNGSDFDDLLVTVADRTPPVFSGLPSDIAAECSGPLGTEVPIVAPTAVDNCDGAVTTLSDAPALFPLGPTLVTFTAIDVAGNSASFNLVVTVEDSTPPDIASLAATPDVLWPPNHAMRSVDIDAAVSDVCDPELPVCFIASVSSNEPVDGLGDADTAPDWEIVDDLTLDLRAERAGNGKGRVYTVELVCSDAGGNGTASNVTVTVPHDRGRR